MRRLAIAAAAVIVLGSCAGDSAPPLLPDETRFGNYEDIDGNWRDIPTRFELAAGLSVNVDHAPAYTLTGGAVTGKGAEQLARAVGMRGPITREGSTWTAGAFDGSGLGFYVADGGAFSLSMYLPPSPCNDNFSSSSGSCVAPTTTTLVAPNIPSLARAVPIARAIAYRAGVGVGDASTVATVEEHGVRVRFIRTVDGLRAKGYEFVLDVVSSGAAGGWGLLATPTRLADYELTSLEHAVSRLNAHSAAYTEQVNVKLRAVEVGLMVALAGDDMWLIPAYIFTTDDGRTVAAPAAQDKYFEESRN